MTRNNLKQLKAWFTEYISDFYSDDPDYNHLIRLKEEHTIRVCRNIAMLGKELGLSDQDMILAETIALFHDIGRFKQYKTYRTFNDLVSENHAKLGLRQMAIHRVLSACTTAEKRLITKSIAYHNAAALPVNENGNTLFFMRLIRDADKLDIWKLFIDYCNEREKKQNSAIELGLPDEPVCSQRVIESLKQRRLVLMQDLKTFNDFKLLQIGWVYDLNFVPSFQTVQNRKYIEKLEETLPESKEIKEAVQQAHDHVNSFVLK
ncbi:MAG: HD domain-containing protein [Deltaproteobacteria bacterium]|nr:HD domain-containing protein [Deltaproteobacteria bacterium]